MPLKNRNLAILAACAALIGVIVYSYYTLVYLPVNRKIEEDRKKVISLNQQLTAAKARAGQLSKIEAEMAGLQVEVAQLEKQLPKERELPSLLRVFTHRAESYGLNMITFTPMKPVSKGQYDEIPFNVSMSASFHSLGHFLTAMGKGERLFAARNLAVNASNNKTDPSKTINVTFQLVAFKYHE